MKRASAWLAAARDLCSLGAGIFGILHQELTGHVNVALLVVYTSLLGVPGAAALVNLVRANAPTITIDTGESSSESPESPSQPVRSQP